MSFGIQIFNANGTSEVFGYNAAGAHFLASGTVSVDAGDTSSAITAEGMTSSNVNTVGVGAAGSNINFPTINRGNGSFTLTNTSGSAADFRFFAFRF